jgi:hypothetical protein
MIQGNVKITISKTATGEGEYLQVISDDLTSVNVVIIADKFEIKDAREE